jgi:hypothetical protein
MTFKNDLEEGMEFQDFIIDELFKKGICLMVYGSRSRQKVSESLNGIEIKFDRKFRQTGNFFLECFSYSYGHFKNTGEVIFHESGILKDDNTWLFVIGDFQNYYVIPKKTLVRYYKKYSDKLREAFYIDDKTNSKIVTAKGLLIKQEMIELMNIMI